MVGSLQIELLPSNYLLRYFWSYPEISRSSGSHIMTSTFFYSGGPVPCTKYQTILVFVASLRCTICGIYKHYFSVVFTLIIRHFFLLIFKESLFEDLYYWQQKEKIYNLSVFENWPFLKSQSFRSHPDISSTNSGVPGSKPLGGTKVDSAFYPS